MAASRVDQRAKAEQTVWAAPEPHGGSGVSMAIAFGLATIAMDMCPSPKIFLDKSIKPGERSGGPGSGGH